EPTGDKDTAGSFKNSLYVNYIKPALDAGATPIIATPVVRRTTSSSWSDSQLHKANGGDYAQAGRDLAAELGLTCIDNTAMTQELYTNLGPDETVYLHAWLNSKSSSVDNTHLNNYGASYVSYMMANALKNSSNSLGTYVKSGIAAPDKTSSLIVNPSYVEPDPDAADLSEEDLAKSVFKTTAPWYGTAFGDIGGVSKLLKNGELAVNTTSGKTNFAITEIDSNTVNIRTGDVATNQSFGKIASSNDAFTLYYMPVDAASNFEISADATVNDVLINSQVSFGAVCLDRVSVDDSNKNLYSYVAAGALKYGETANVTFARIDDTLTSNVTKSYTPAKGDTVKVRIVKAGDKFKVTYGDVTETYTNKMSGTVYFGFYTTRNADVTFGNITFNNEIVEDDPNENTTGAAAEVTTEVTTEATTQATTQAATEATTQATTEATTEVTTEATTEAAWEPVNDFIPSIGVNQAPDCTYDNYNIVFTSAADSLDYAEAGFIFKSRGKTVRRSTNTVYSSIEDSLYTPEELGGKYVYSFTIEKLADAVEVTPYLIDLNGNEILGTSYYFDGIDLGADDIPSENADSNTVSKSDIKENAILPDETLSGSAVITEIPEVA
ncbi:MAG: hypothetical protein IJR59_05040, partial [Firmicutes bacterium]|nr:hypothetical protein [Bacillota bacterium]